MVTFEPKISTVTLKAPSHLKRSAARGTSPGSYLRAIQRLLCKAGVRNGLGLPQQTTRF